MKTPRNTPKRWQRVRTGAALLLAALIITAASPALGQQQLVFRDAADNTFTAQSWLWADATPTWSTPPTTIDNVTPLKLPISSIAQSLSPEGAQQKRTFEIRVSDDGPVATPGITSFDFTYTPQPAIQPVAIVLEGFPHNSTGGAITLVGTLPYPALPTALADNVATPSSASVTHSITNDDIDRLLGFAAGSGMKLRLNDIIRVTEYFNVVRCSTPSPPPTTYAVSNWTCSNLPCPTSAPALRTLEVQSGIANISMGLAVGPSAINPTYPPAIELCPGGAQDDLLVQFTNTSASNGDRFMKTLHKIKFHMKQDAFVVSPIPHSNVFLEDQDGNRVNVTTIDPNFYDYVPDANGITHSVILNFDLLSSPSYIAAVAGFPNWPLINGFIPEGTAPNPAPGPAIHNEMPAGARLFLRFTDVEFDCAGARAYTRPGQTQGFTFADGKDEYQPALYYQHMFFGFGLYNQLGSSNNQEAVYDDMCGPRVPPQAIGMNMANNYPVTAIAQTNKTDVAPPTTLDPMADQATIDFFWSYNGTPSSNANALDPTDPDNPSPFKFGQIGFECSSVTYQVEVRIPHKPSPLLPGDSETSFSLDAVRFYDDPNGSSWVPLTHTGPIGHDTVTLSWPNPVRTECGKPNLTDQSTIVLHYDVYTFTSTTPLMTFEGGRLSIDVTMIDCPPNCGDFADFSAKIQAICGGCTQCPYTVAEAKTELYYHCNGGCSNVPQDTWDFRMERETLGWKSDAMNDLVSVGNPNLDSPRIWTNRSYNCDLLIAESNGQFGANEDVCKLGFHIKYSVPAGSTQFFELQPGSTLQWGSAPAVPVTQAELSTSFTTTTGSWPSSPTSGVCELFINFPDTTWLQSIENLAATGVNVPLKLTLRLRVAKDLGSPISFPYYNLRQIRAGFVSSANNDCNTLVESCDTWGASQLVQNVRTVTDFRIYYPNSSNAAFGIFAQNACRRFFLLGTQIQGGLPGLNHYPNEFRPVFGWTPNVVPPTPLQFRPSITIPSGQGIHFITSSTPLPPCLPGCYNPHINTAEFKVLDDHTNWPVWEPVTTNVIGQTVEFLGINNGSGTDPWPILSAEGDPVRVYIRGTLTNECPSDCDPHPSANCVDIGFDFPVVEGYYEDPSTTCNLVYPDIEPTPTSGPVTRPVTMKYTNASPVTVAVTRTPSAIQIASSPFAIPNVEYRLTSKSAPISGAWIRATSPGLCITSIDRTDTGNVHIGILPDSNGYFCIGDVRYGFPAQLTLHGTLADPATLSGGSPTWCSPWTQCTILPGQLTSPITITIESGFACLGCPGPQDDCDPTSVDFDIDVIPQPSALTISATRTDLACDEFEYCVEIKSTLNAEVHVPELQIKLPSGVSFVGPATYTATTLPATCPLVGANTVPIILTPATTEVWDWDIDNDVYSNQGMPPQPSVLFVIFTVAGCAGGQVEFTLTGSDICERPLQPELLFDTLPLGTDSTPPSIDVCPPDFDVPCPTQSTDPAVTGTPIATDNCGLLPLSYVDVVGSCDPLTGRTTITRTWTAEDLCGNTDTCVQLITWAEPLDLECPPTSVHLGTNGPPDPCSVQKTLVSGNIGCIPLICNAGAILTPNPGHRSQSFTIQATDGCGNTSTCTWVYTWEIPPTIQCPADTEVFCPNQSIDPAVTGTPTLIDACPPVTLAYTDVHGPCDAVTGKTVTTRTWTVLDGNGHTATCDQLITWVRPLELICPFQPSSTINLGPGGGPPPQCPIQTLLVTGYVGCGPTTCNSGPILSPGPNPEDRSQTFTVSFTDGCGNTSTCTWTYLWTDTTPPTITCPPDVILSCDNQDITDLAVTGTATAVGHCSGIASITYVDSPPTPCDPATGLSTTIRTWTATDNCGNTATCDQLITWTRPLDPICPFLPSGTVHLGVDPPLPLPCPLQTLLVTGYVGCATTHCIADPVLSSGPLGLNKSQTFTIELTDPCGNSTSCTWTYTWTVSDQPIEFIRGDANADGSVNIADAVRILSFLFGGGAPFDCADAADANDDGGINIADGVAVLSALFGSPALPLPAPYPGCGIDPTPDALDCGEYLMCP